MTKKIPLIIIIILVIIVIALVIVFSGVKKEGKEAEEESRLEKEAPVIAKEIYGFSGEIKEVYLDKILSVEVKILLADSQKEPLKQIVKIKVTDETRILKLKFPEEIPEGSIEPIFPQETEVGFDDLEVGNRLDIKTTENVSENIKNKTEIEASVINIVK